MKRHTLLAIIAAMLLPLAAHGESAADALKRLQELETQYRNATSEAERTRLAREMTEADSLWCEALTLENYSRFRAEGASHPELLTMANALYNNAGEEGRTKASALYTQLAEENNPVALNYRGILCSDALEFSKGADYFKASVLATSGRYGMYLPAIHNLARNLLTMAAMTHIKGTERLAGSLVDMAAGYVEMYRVGVDMLIDPNGAKTLPPYSIAEYTAEILNRDGTDSAVEVDMILSGRDLRRSYQALCIMTGRKPYWE